MTLELILAALVALIAGAAVGWLVWGRAAARLRDKFVAAIRDVEALTPLKSENERLRAIEIEHTRFKAATEERDRQHGEQLAALETRFAGLAQRVLDNSQSAFVARAEETLKRHREAAAEGLAQNRVALGELIAPMRETLDKYEKKLGEIEAARQTAYGAIANAIADVRAGQERVQGEAAKLVSALRNAPKARGRWGEHQLRRVLEMAGLSRHVDFAEEVSVTADDGRLRPDAIVRLPGDRVLVIDAKCSLASYQDAVAAADEDERRGHMLAHAKALRAHVDTLGRKSYAEQFDETLDFVIMFVPGENFLAAALEVDDGLFEAAFDRKVLLASPTNLIAIARTVALVWQQEKAADDARQIAALGKELHDRIATMSGHVAKLGKHLGTAAGAYNEFVASLDRNVLTTAQRFRDLAIEAPAKTIEPPTPVAADLKASAKLQPPAEAAE
jgi:DNA recombination protein RmuC